MPSPIALHLAGLLIATAAAVAAPAEDAAERPDEASAFGDVVDVQLINVEVWVTDRKGRPVTGLTAADFEVLEDGRPVEISHFAEVRERAPAADGAIAPLASTGPPAEANRDDGAGHLVIYFDELHLGIQGRQRLVKDLRKFLAAQRVEPERILILRQGDDLSLAAPFSSSAEEIAEAVSRFAKPSGRSTQASTEKDLQLASLKTLWQARRQVRNPCPAFVASAMAGIESYAAQARVRVETTLQHLSDVSTFLAGVPGVKTLLYLSDSLDLRPGADLVNFVDAICPLRDHGFGVPSFALSSGLGQALSDLTRHANTNRVTIYTLQASGLRTDTFFGADQQTVDRVEMDGSKRFARARKSNDRDGMVVLASETGGRAIFNQGRFDDDFEKIRREMGSYYSLAYAPLHDGDGLMHSIEVEVTRPKTSVRHRQAYRDKSAEERMTERLHSALFLGVGENPLAVRLAAGTVRAEDGKRVTLPLHVLVPADRLAFLPQAGGDRAAVRLQVVSRDVESGKLKSVEKSFEAPRPSGATEQLDFAVGLGLGTSTYVVAVGLRDEATRVTSFVSTTVEIQDPG